MPAKIVLKKEQTGKFRFLLLSSNGKPIATSEAHANRAGAVRAIESLRNGAVNAAVDDQTAAATAPAVAAAKKQAPVAVKAAAKKQAPARKKPAATRGART